MGQGGICGWLPDTYSDSDPSTERRFYTEIFRAVRVDFHHNQPSVNKKFDKFVAK